MDFDLDYDLIGIGEETHGELTSWNIRYNIIKKLIKSKKKVYILCEQFDGYVKDLNQKNVNFFFENSRFYPYMIAGSQFTKEHLEITKKFNKLLPHVHFFGIDIQAVKYDHMYNLTDPILKRILHKYKKLYLKYDKGSGIYRNYYNAKIIQNLIKEFKTKNTSFVYFAQNEHISFMSKKNIKNYKPEGYLFKYKFNINYLSICTIAINQYNTWNCLTKKKCKVQLNKIKSKKWEKLFKEDKKKTILLDKNYKYKLPFTFDYNNKDFDYVIAEYESKNMLLLNC